MTEINITPFTDVVLVLLIIFIIATPMIYQANLKVSLPDSQTAKADEKPQKLTVQIDAQGNAFIDNSQFSLNGDLTALKKKIQSLSEGKKDTAVLINADRNSKYDYVIRVIDASKAMGVNKIILGTGVKR
jgi:biopolymer transport protein TolR